MSRRRKIVLAMVLGAGLLVFDLTRAPERQWTARGLLLAIDAYQATLSPRMSGLGVSCRFEPSCSHYTEAAIRHRGTVSGLLHGASRIARCGPWTPLGTVDPPPPPRDARPAHESHPREPTP